MTTISLHPSPGEVVRANGGRRSLVSLLSDIRTPLLVFITIWVLGLGAFAAVRRADATISRETQTLLGVAALERQLVDLNRHLVDLNLVAAGPALAVPGIGPTLAQSKLRYEVAKQSFRASLSNLDVLLDPALSARLKVDARAHLVGLDRIAALLVRRDSLSSAVAALGRTNQPGGSHAVFVADLRQTSAHSRGELADARTTVLVTDVAAFSVLLLAFSLALYHATRVARQKHVLLESSRVDAHTDALTGLPNRRQLFTDMDAILADPPAGVLALGMFDLDGFKEYNDTFGHPAGDSLLARLGERLAAAVDGRGSAYRMGGDEFCVIAVGPEPERVFSAAAEALSERCGRSNISCSRGSIVIAPNEMTVEQALQQADQRLYESKRFLDSRKGGEAHHALLRVLSERSHSLATHLTAVGMLAEAVARKLGLSEAEITLTRWTAELHDVGKVAIPDAILEKSGPLDEGEWTIMKRHTIIGERIIAATPALAAVAPLVRSSHERPDGSGYPDGLLADAIPISSSIVAVVDAYDAMTSERPYSFPLDHDDAIGELRRGAGTQFDPAVTEAFIAVCRETARRHPTHSRATTATIAA